MVDLGAPLAAGKLFAIATLLWASTAFAMDGTCTGSIIAKDTILTAAHCVTEVPPALLSRKRDPQGAQRASVPSAPEYAVKVITKGPKLIIEFTDGSRTSGEVIRKGHHANVDLALIKAATGRRKPVIIASHAQAVPDACVHVGTGGDGRLKTMGCVLTPLRPTQDGLRIIKTNGLPGDSGGPVIGRNSELVGVFTRLDSDEPTAYVEPFYRINEFINTR